MKCLLFYLWLPSIKVGFVPFDFNPLYTWNLFISTLANIEDLDKMSNNEVFHQGLHCLRKQKWSSEKEKHYFWKV